MGFNPPIGGSRCCSTLVFDGGTGVGEAPSGADRLRDRVVWWTPAASQLQNQGQYSLRSVTITTVSGQTVEYGAPCYPLDVYTFFPKVFTVGLSGITSAQQQQLVNIPHSSDLVTLGFRDIPFTTTMTTVTATAVATTALSTTQSPTRAPTGETRGAIPTSCPEFTSPFADGFGAPGSGYALSWASTNAIISGFGWSPTPSLPLFVIRVQSGNTDIDSIAMRFSQPNGARGCCSTSMFEGGYRVGALPSPSGDTSHDQVVWWSPSSSQLQQAGVYTVESVTVMLVGGNRIEFGAPCYPLDVYDFFPFQFEVGSSATILGPAATLSGIEESSDLLEIGFELGASPTEPSAALNPEPTAGLTNLLTSPPVVEPTAGPTSLPTVGPEDLTATPTTEPTPPPPALVDPTPSPTGIGPTANIPASLSGDTTTGISSKEANIVNQAAPIVTSTALTSAKPAPWQLIIVFDGDFKTLKNPEAFKASVVEALISEPLNIPRESIGRVFISDGSIVVQLEVHTEEDGFAVAEHVATGALSVMHDSQVYTATSAKLVGSETISTDQSTTTLVPGSPEAGSSAQDSGSSGDATGSIVGAVIGVIVVAIGLAFLIYRRRPSKGEQNVTGLPANGQFSMALKQDDRGGGVAETRLDGSVATPVYHDVGDPPGPSCELPDGDGSGAPLHDQNSHIIGNAASSGTTTPPAVAPEYAVAAPVEYDDAVLANGEYGTVSDALAQQNSDGFYATLGSGNDFSMKSNQQFRLSSDTGSLRLKSVRRDNPLATTASKAVDHTYSDLGGDQVTYSRDVLPERVSMKRRGSRGLVMPLNVLSEDVVQPARREGWGEQPKEVVVDIDETDVGATPTAACNMYHLASATTSPAENTFVRAGHRSVRLASVRESPGRAMDMLTETDAIGESPMEQPTEA